MPPPIKTANPTITRREFMTGMVAMGSLAACSINPILKNTNQISEKNRPNIILMMADDMGWGDVGWNGNTIIKTPNLDSLANSGVRLDRFYSGAPVCSPTRATCLTGRHYFRYGIWKANQGALPVQEITLPKVLKQAGYTTGHFGKWHLGSPNRNYKGKNSGDKHLALPEWFGYDEHFVTHHAVATWNPYGPKGERAATTENPYWQNGDRVLEDITGDDSRIMMDRILPFVQDAVASETPFFTVIWFHAPHAPVKAGPEYRAMYSKYSDLEQNYYGCITALDDQVGRLRSELEKLGALDDTMLWFCSDNGPESNRPGTTGGHRGRKRSLFNGGVGSPAFLHWPNGPGRAGSMVESPTSTFDYLPTILEMLDLEMPDHRPLDGLNIMPILTGTQSHRNKAIPFRYQSSEKAMYGSPTAGMIDDQFKFLTNYSDSGEEDMLFDLCADRYEEHNIIADYPDRARKMKQDLQAFLVSAENSHSGGDYDDPGFKPLSKWSRTLGDWKVNNKQKKKKK